MILYIQSQFMVKLLNFSFYGLEDTYMSQIFFMDTRHQKDELIVEFFGMLMSERSKTIRIPSLHVNKLSKLRQIQCVFNCQIRYAISCNLISNAHDAIHYLMLSGVLSLALLVFNEETNNINIRKGLKFFYVCNTKKFI